MIEVIMTVKKEEVYDEISKTTSYAGSKIDIEAYERMFTTEEDSAMLDRFWSECKSSVCAGLKEVLCSEAEDSTGQWVLKLGLSNAFDGNLVSSMQDSLFSFFVMAITAKWYSFTNKPESSGCATEADVYLEDVMRKAFYKRKPKRPSYL